MTSVGREHGGFAGAIGRRGILLWPVIALVLGGDVAANAPPGRSPAEARRVLSGKPMPDGKEWMVKNLAREADGSFCYAGLELNCRLYGRLYTLADARRACAALGGGWRLPTGGEWRALEAAVGGGSSSAAARKAYQALVAAGPTGFEGVHGGRRTAEGQYEALAARGFYWADTPADRATATYYELRREQATFGRHEDGDPRMALSVRCVRTPATPR